VYIFPFTDRIGIQPCFILTGELMKLTDWKSGHAPGALDVHGILALAGMVGPLLLILTDL
jgi:hypothetical protein